ncbi:hypothetical protein [Pseudoalteromonas byunsanensis]|uniref:Uncharacterized protein n=1 Tax=Pseudoalteromonas byunsanensis TaxID=327939 RepID=A0A1S1N5K7_9GAMM|nr:hypothetical protein [Pseudoalteromonas byunsanensis]OHU93543.1 hypothetical protein BIW53_19560 [Pseudoalteromonas byunsanensis]
MSESAAMSLDSLVHQNSISAGPLPKALQFTFLKNAGITSLKALAGSSWSNYNDSDPGVTILEQIVFALTELGYVNTFDIVDVLTQPDGSIDYQQQFYAIDEILTTGPVSIGDYRKLVVDSISEINNVYLQPLSLHEQLTGLYQVWLYVPHFLTQQTVAPQVQQALCSAVYQLLNKHRNLGEYFLMPQVLRKNTVTLSGEVLLTQDADPEQVHVEIMQVLRDYVSPQVKKAGYQQARTQGESAEQIFDGPRLQNGWMLGDNPLGSKRSVIQKVELITLISQVSGVTAVESFNLNAQDDVQSVSIAADEIAQLELGADFTLIQHQAPLNMQPWQQTNLLSQIEAHCQNQSIASQVDLTPKKPTGRYRDIESYYSIQNTFPDIYAVGINSLESDASAHRIAQSRQLKGYLLLFDQVLANQFSQLANLSNLFTFGFDIVPTSQQQFYQQSQAQSAPMPPAIPSQSFIRSYFYQPLYDVPDVQALLKGQQHYQFFYPDDPSDAAQRSTLVWQRFKDDPFNQYNHGLSEIIENQQEAQLRRDTMLSHLLARQGEPADLYDDIIDASQWYGSRLQTRIIIKSIWMQNLQQLSYRRAQALQFIFAQILPTPGRYRLSFKHYKQLIATKSNDFGKIISGVYQQGFSDKGQLARMIATLLVKQAKKHAKAKGKESKIDTAKVLKQSRALAVTIPLSDGNQLLLDNSQQRLMLDGQYDAQALDAYGKLSTQDFANFSVFELKLDLLMGFALHLRTLAAALVTLVNDPDFVTWLGQPTDVLSTDESQQEGQASFNIDDIVAERGATQLNISISGKQVMALPNPGSSWQVADIQQYIDQLAWLSGYRKGVLLIEHTLLQSAAVQVSSQSADSDDWYYLTSSIVLPDYVSLVNQSKFIYFIRAIQQLHWPSHVTLDLLTANVTQFIDLIDNYCQWFNQQRLIERHPVVGSQTAQQALSDGLKDKLQLLTEVPNDDV